MDRGRAGLAQPLGAAHEARALPGTRPGGSPRTAESRLAASGTELTRFPHATHLASWAGLCPGHHDRGGTRRSGQTRPGSRWVRQVLVEVAQVAATTKQTEVAAPYQRLAARRGKPRARMALGHTLLVPV
jgi:transposase